MIRKLHVLFFFLISSVAIGQLDYEHHVPPVYPSTHGWLYPNDQVVYISTPTTTPVNYSIQDGAGNVLKNGVVSNANPISYAMAGLNTDFLVNDADLNKVLTDRGIHVIADEKVYCNVRANAGGGARPNATSMTAKGRAALGKSFRIGHFPSPQNFNDGQNSLATKSSTVGIYATKDNTQISIDLTSRQPVLRGAGAPSTANVINITLNKGETYVFAIKNTDSPLNRNKGMIGGLITSNKNIAVNTGSWGGNLANANVVDIGLDQIVPANRIGTEYAVVRGALTRTTPQHERVMIVGHEDNTEIKVNGVVVTTINAGEYYLIPSNKYSAQGAMYVETSVPSYAYQFMMGSNDYNYKTQGMNFLPPISCRTTNFVDNIPFVEKIGAKTYGGAISIVTTQGATLTVTADGVNQNIGNATPVPASNYEQYKITGLTGNVAVYSNTIALVSIVGQNSAAGYGGFFSGFVDNQISDEASCLPGYIFEPSGRYESYQWFRNGVELPGETNDSLFATETGYYTFEYTLASCKDTSDSILAVGLNKFELEGDTFFCAGDSVEWNIVGTGFDSVSWETGEQAQNIFIKTDRETNVRIYSDITRDCFVDTMVPSIAEFCPVELIEVDTLIICRGDTALIGGIHMIDPTWTGESYTNVNDSTIKAYPDETSVYIVERSLSRKDLLVNSDFENVPLSGTHAQLDASLVDGWNTTATDNKIEIWRDGFLGHPAYSGTFFAELNATQPSALYQDVEATPGEIIRWGFAHRGRNTDETMQLKIGPSGGPYEVIGDFTDGPTAWGYYSGEYVVPTGQANTRFLFSANDGDAAANLIDAPTFEAILKHTDSVTVIVNSCPTDIGVTKTDGADKYYSGTTTIYSIVAKNLGPSPVKKGVVEDPVPVGISAGDITWTATAYGGATSIISGVQNGALLDTVDIPVNDSVVYTVNITVPLNFVGDLENTVTITADNDTFPDNNTATDIDTKDCNFQTQGTIDSKNAGWVKMGNVINGVPYQISYNGGTKTFIPVDGPEEGQEITTVVYNTATGWSVSLSRHRYNNSNDYGNTISSYDNTPHGWTGLSGTGLEQPPILGFMAFIDQNGNGTFDSGLEEYFRDITSLKFAPSATGELYMAFYDDGVYTDNAGIININVQSELESTDIGQDTAVCLGESVLLDAQNPDAASWEWNTGETSQTILVDSAGEYSVEITSVGGCEINDTIHIQTHSVEVVAPSDTGICQGDSVEIVAQSDSAQVWNWNNGETSQFITVNATGEYKITVANSFGCLDSDSVQVTVHTLPTVTLSDTTICPGDSAQFTAVSSTAEEYLWSENASGVHQTYIGYSEGIYKVIITDINNCKDTTQATLTHHEPPVVTVNNDTICIGDPAATFTASSPTAAQYSWSENGQGNQPTASGTTAGNYTVIVEDINTCKDTATGVLLVDTLPVVVVNDTVICSDVSSILLTAYSTTAVGYEWGGLGSGTALSISANDAGSYTVMVTDENGCKQQDDALVQKVQQPEPFDIEGDLFACEGEEIDLLADVNTQLITWNTNETTKNITVTTTGVYSVVVANQAFGITCSDSASFTATFLPYPEQPGIQDFTNCFEYNTPFMIDIPTDVDVAWDGFENRADSTLLVTKDGTYYADLSIYPQCSITVSVDVEDFCPMTFYVPNAFTPNKDGINETFEPKMYNIVTYQIIIYNRWGERIFTSTNPEVQWDGTYLNEEVQQDVYVYKIIYSGYGEDQSLDKKQLTGTVTLIR